jgi:hypothetical protein
MQTPAKSAIQQFIENFVISAVLTGFFTAYPLVAGNSPDWATGGRTFLFATLFALATSVKTYYQLKPPPDTAPAVPPTQRASLLEEGTTYTTRPSPSSPSHEPGEPA